MANVNAVYSVGSSLMTSLRNAYPAPLRQAFPCDFRVISSGELAGNADRGTALTLYLFRVTINEHLRNVRRVNDNLDAQPPLGLDLHYLLTAWADNAPAEHTILAWAMQQIYQRPVLDASSLDTSADWGASDVIQLIPAELSNEDVMRIWDALDPAYRLSVSYIARVVRIAPDATGGGLPVVATRSRWGSKEAVS
jgi:hypothetical protein